MKGRKMQIPDDVTGARITKIMMRHNLTDKDVANMMGVHEETVTRWRRGETEPPISFIRFICLTFNVSADWLLDLKGRRNE